MRIGTLCLSGGQFHGIVGVAFCLGKDVEVKHSGEFIVALVPLILYLPYFLSCTILIETFFWLKDGEVAFLYGHGFPRSMPCCRISVLLPKLIIHPYFLLNTFWARLPLVMMYMPDCFGLSLIVRPLRL